MKHPPPPSRQQHQSCLAGDGFWRAGGGGRDRGRGQSVSAVPRPEHLPLKDAGILPTHGEQVGVTVGEADVGDVAAVAFILVAWCLRFGTGVLEEVHLTEVISHGHHPLIMGATQCVNVCAVRALQPHTHDMEAQHTRVGSPFSVLALIAVPQQLTA